MNAKHQFKYTYNETDIEEYSPLEVTFEVPATATITQMLNNFEQYLKACGYVFDGRFDIVEDTYPEYLDELVEEESGYGCMADFDKECGCEDTSSPLETSEWNNQFDVTKNTSSSKDSKWTNAEKMLKEWNEGIAKLDNELKTQREIREKASKSADMVKDFNDAYAKLTEEQKMDAFKKACEMSGLHYEATKEVAKNNWVHGICNPPSPDLKAQNKERCDGLEKYLNWVAMNKNK